MNINRRSYYKRCKIGKPIANNCDNNIARIISEEHNNLKQIYGTIRLKYYIDRTNLKVIGTTTEKEYNEFFSSDALKRRFEKIIVKEPIEEDLYKIIDKVISDYCINNKITFENENIREEIINIILNSIDKKHRLYNDSINNPDLSISIIDKAFAFAKVYDSKYITIEHFIESFEFCDRIYESKREEAIANLKSIDKSTTKPIQRILKVNFNKFKK